MSHLTPLQGITSHQVVKWATRNDIGAYAVVEILPGPTETPTPPKTIVVLHKYADDVADLK